MTSQRPSGLAPVGAEGAIVVFGATAGKRDGTNKRPAVDRHPARGTHRHAPGGSCQPE